MDSAGLIRTRGPQGWERRNEADRMLDIVNEGGSEVGGFSVIISQREQKLVAGRRRELDAQL